VTGTDLGVRPLIARTWVVMRIGIDTGGTFTDLVDDRGEVLKIPSTPDDPARAVHDAVARVTAGGGDVALLAHGTTVATNALLERRLGRVALVTNRGFADVVEIARQARPSLYDLRVDRPAALVPREWRYEVAGRLDARGRQLEPFDGAVPDIASEVETVAVCLLHSDLDPGAEHEVATAISAATGLDVVCSADVSPEFREYERMVTTLTDAALRPACSASLASLDGLAREVLVMTSAGGLVPVRDAAAHPAHLLLSGPAGGAQAAAAVATACGHADAVAFDMGGTSTDVCLVLDGAPAAAGDHTVAGFPIRLPSLAVHTIGAGGGSIAALDSGGALVVGPRSSGARPGPACYGHGGKAPTVTDADLVLGRIPADHPLPGLGRLDVVAAQAALDRAGVTAEGVVAVVDAAMERAVRAVTSERGVDPRGLALVAFGGAGPLHACAVAEALGMDVVIVPARAGAFSAVGLVTSPRRRELVASWRGGTDAELAAALRALANRARAAVGGLDAVVDTFVDCRYLGQSHELTVPTVADFAAAHARANGYTRDGVAAEVVALRARASRPAPLRLTELPAADRSVVTGPAVAAELDCTMWVPGGWVARPGPTGAWVVTRA
jgi:N-methylhydantoinase A/oxoprolinase/acetone carboxylase beta subunit